ncbi:nucleotide-diphosphate-sugar epimerase [Actinoplanes ianthinogenes]|uniref:Nucleotide-diphosphate-sugar epimerase n=1 Tax=Actinoplanes ianthinogenes TaxID=122358 RepID=A0ABM7M926_9ACTN|nr:NAD(P)H-binding protein [Actinoplanes ianthinogenes]BCJ48120.1 nucleotide-diphosphate-sugar epimerase [Actinoplanes ianthinogenes]GGR06562.1 nucleotide-diphosphate-sugar epimerase [Actinoplanes ianthinogenes]
MTIAITTPTGNVGSRTLRLLLQAGIRPRVLLRDPGRLDPGLHDNVEIAQGDLLDPAFVRDATQDVDTLLWATPENFTADDPLAEMATMVDNGTAAVHANRVPRIVLISSIGAELGTGAGMIDGLARSEHEFTATGASVHTLRCGYYFTNLHGYADELRAGSLTTAAAPHQPMAWVDPRDVGEVAAARLLNPHWTGTTIQAVHGPADLTWTQAADILSTALDTKITLNVVSDDTMAAGLAQAGMSPRAAAAVLAMTTGLRDGFTPEQTRTPITTTPTTLHAWAATHLTR